MFIESIASLHLYQASAAVSALRLAQNTLGGLPESAPGYNFGNTEISSARAQLSAAMARVHSDQAGISFLV